MKIGVLIPEISANLPEMLEKMAGIGAEGVQFYVKNKHYDLTGCTAEELRQLKKRIDNLGLELPAICGELGGHGFQIREENPQKLATLKHIIDMAEILETPVVSTHIGVIPDDTESPIFKAVLEAMTEAGIYAKSKGIGIAIETGPETPEVLKMFLDMTEGGVGANLDPANLVMVHNVNAAHSAEVLKGHILHTHAKDGINLRKCDAMKVYNAFAEGGFEQLVAESGELFKEVPLGEGNVNFPEYIPALKKAGYDGYLTIEREVGAKPFDDIKMAVAFLKNLL